MLNLGSLLTKNIKCADSILAKLCKANFQARGGAYAENTIEMGIFSAVS